MPLAVVGVKERYPLVGVGEINVKRLRRVGIVGQEKAKPVRTLGKTGSFSRKPLPTLRLLEQMLKRIFVAVEQTGCAVGDVIQHRTAIDVADIEGVGFAPKWQAHNKQHPKHKPTIHSGRANQIIPSKKDKFFPISFYHSM